jgi:hypothetical protein
MLQEKVSTLNEWFVTRLEDY